MGIFIHLFNVNALKQYVKNSFGAKKILLQSFFSRSLLSS